MARLPSRSVYSIARLRRPEAELVANCSRSTCVDQDDDVEYFTERSSSPAGVAPNPASEMPPWPTHHPKHTLNVQVINEGIAQDKWSVVQAAAASRQQLICFEFFLQAVDHGSVQVLGGLASCAAEALCLHSIVEANDCHLLRLATTRENHVVVELLLRWLSPFYPILLVKGIHEQQLHRHLAAFHANPITSHGMVTKLFYSAARHGQVQAMKVLRRWSPWNLFVDSYVPGAMVVAAEHGQVDAMHQMVNWSSDRVKKRIIQDIMADSFVVAARNGHADVLKAIRGFCAQEQWHQIIESHGHGMLQHAYHHKHFDVCDVIIEESPAQQREATIRESCGWNAFSNVVFDDHLRQIQFIMQWASEATRWEMLSSYGFHVFRNAKSSDCVNMLLNWAPDQEKQQQMIQANDYWTFRQAAGAGCVEVVQAIAAACRDDGARAEMLQSQSYSAFECAAKNGHVGVVETLLQVCAEEMRLNMIKANEFAAYRCAAENGHLDVMKAIARWIPAESRRHADLMAIQAAKEHGQHLNVIEAITAWSR